MSHPPAKRRYVKKAKPIDQAAEAADREAADGTGSRNADPSERDSTPASAAAEPKAFTLFDQVTDTTGMIMALRNAYKISTDQAISITSLTLNYILAREQLNAARNPFGPVVNSTPEVSEEAEDND